MNYYKYTDDAGLDWSVRMTPEVAVVTLALLATGQPRLAAEVRTRKTRMYEFVTGRELLMIAPYMWPFTLGELVTYKGDVWLVAELLPEEYKLEKP